MGSWGKPEEEKKGRTHVLGIEESKRLCFLFCFFFRANLWRPYRRWLGASSETACGGSRAFYISSAPLSLISLLTSVRFYLFVLDIKSDGWHHNLLRDTLTWITFFLCLSILLYPSEKQQLRRLISQFLSSYTINIPSLIRMLTNPVILLYFLLTT